MFNGFTLVSHQINANVQIYLQIVKAKEGHMAMIELAKYQVVDLTHAISPEMPIWPGDPRTEVVQVSTIKNQGYFLNRLTIGEHTGTHMGAPVHFVTGGRDVSEIDTNSLIAPACTINIFSATVRNPDYLLQGKDVEEWENKHGQIADGAVVLVETGWSRFWNEPEVTFRSKHFQIRQDLTAEPHGQTRNKNNGSKYFTNT